MQGHFETDDLYPWYVVVEGGGGSCIPRHAITGEQGPAFRFLGRESFSKCHDLAENWIRTQRYFLRPDCLDAASDQPFFAA